MCNLSFYTRDRTPAVEMQSLNHWIIGGVCMTSFVHCAGKALIPKSGKDSVDRPFDELRFFVWFLVAQMIKNACSAGDPGSISVLGRSPGEGNGNTLQNSCLENSIDRGTWQATVHGVAKSGTGLSD